MKQDQSNYTGKEL